MGKINLNSWKTTIDNLLGDVSDWDAPIGQKIYLCEFDIVSGFIYINERGEDTLLTNPQENKTNMMVQTSNEPIVAYWKDSFKSIKLENQNLQRKEFKVGVHYEAYLQSEEIGMDNGQIVWNQNTFNSFSVNKAIHVYVPDFDCNRVDIVKKLFLIPNTMGESLQWLRVVAMRPNYNVQRGKSHGAYLTLVNLNQLFQSSGRDILTMVQIFQPGGNCAIPYVYKDDNGNERLGVDYKYVMKTKGANACQLEFTSPVYYNGCFMYGRPKNNFFIEPSRLLLPYKYNVPQTSPLSSYATPINNYFMCYNLENVYEALYEDWSAKLESKFNTLSEKTFNGGLQMINRDLIEGTNPLNSGGQYSLVSFSNWPFSYQQDVEYKLNSNSFIRTETITFPSGYETNFINHMNNTAIIMSNINEMPQSYKDTIRFSLSDIPFGFGNLITGILGFDPSWSFNNRYVPSPKLMGCMPCTTYEMAATIMNWDTDISTQKMPFDFFSNNPAYLSSFGSRQIVSSFNFSFSDRFQSSDAKYIKEGKPEGQGGNGIWNTIYLNQTQYEDGTAIFDDGAMLTWDPVSCVAIAPEVAYQEYEVDFIDYKVVGKCDCRLTFYNENGFKSQIESLYENRHMTNCKYKDDALLWDNHFVLNFSNNENNEGYFTYPSAVNPPLPIGEEDYFLPTDTNMILFPRDLTLKKGDSVWDVFNTTWKLEDDSRNRNYTFTDTYTQKFGRHDILEITNYIAPHKYNWNNNENHLFNITLSEEEFNLLSNYKNMILTCQIPNTYNSEGKELGVNELIFKIPLNTLITNDNYIIQLGNNNPQYNINNNFNPMALNGLLYFEKISVEENYRRFTTEELNNVLQECARYGGWNNTRQRMLHPLDYGGGIFGDDYYYMRFLYDCNSNYELIIKLDKINKQISFSFKTLLNIYVLASDEHQSNSWQIILFNNLWFERDNNQNYPNFILEEDFSFSPFKNDILISEIKLTNKV